ncbi:MAG: FHA domain-containing protein, partial [Thermoguttaceae bacterium]
MSYLYVIQGYNQGCRFEIRGEVVTIGRDESNDFQLHDSEVSRRHAEIRTVDGKLLLIDNESSNGSFVNGYRVKKAQLHSGDQIQLGRSLLLFSHSDEEEQNLNEQNVVYIDFSDDPLNIIESIPQDEGTWLFDGSFDPNYKVELGGLAGSELNLPGESDKHFSRMR